MCIEHSFALWRKTVFWVLSKPEIVFFRNWNSKLWQTYRNNLLHKQLQLYHPFCIFCVNIAKGHRTYIFFHDASSARPQKMELNIYFLCHFTLVKAGSKKSFPVRRRVNVYFNKNNIKRIEHIPYCSMLGIPIIKKPVHWFLVPIW